MVPAVVHINPTSSSGFTKRKKFISWAESKADILDLWAPFLLVMIQRPRPLPAAGREWGIVQKAHPPPPHAPWVRTSQQRLGQSVLGNKLH